MQNVICSDAGEYSVTVGPVKKGFKADMAVSLTDAYDLTKYIAIDVAEGSSPFAQKVMLSNGITLSYIVGE